MVIQIYDFLNDVFIDIVRMRGTYMVSPPPKKKKKSNSLNLI